MNKSQLFKFTNFFYYTPSKTLNRYGYFQLNFILRANLSNLHNSPLPFTSNQIFNLLEEKVELNKSKYCVIILGHSQCKLCEQAELLTKRLILHLDTIHPYTTIILQKIDIQNSPSLYNSLLPFTPVICVNQQIVSTLQINIPNIRKALTEAILAST